jgi:hypothetical protein
MLEPSKNGLAWIDDLTGGLNTTDPPAQIQDNQLQAAVNIEWTQTRVAQRRQGGQNNIGTEPWGSSKSIVGVWRHTPSNDETAAELLGMDNSATVVLGRLAASANFAAVTVGDAISNASQADVASFNGKAFIAYDSAVDRLHVLEVGTLRRAGLAKPGAAPTVANTGGGAYAAVQRWYKVQWVNNAVAPAVRSELSDSVAFTPSGAGTAARVTRPALPSESEVQWLLFGSPDNVNFYPLAAAVVATTTIDDSVAPSAYATTLPTLTGFPADPDTYTVPPSPKYLLVDGARLLMFSSWETVAYQSRLWFTPLLNTSKAIFSIADDERVPSTNFLDLDPSDGGGLTGAAMLNGSPYAFKIARIYKLNATVNAAKPYARTVISQTVGALSHRSIVRGEDDAGNQCLYFLSRRGPYRLGPYGLEFLGHDLEYGTWSAINKSPTTKPFGVYYEQKHQVWWWVGSGNTPDTVLVFSIPHGRRQGDGSVRGGWTTFTGDIASALAAAMFSQTLAATMSLDLKPYVAQVNNAGSDPDGPLVQYDADAVTTDGGARATTYNATFKTKAFAPGGRDKRGGLLEGFLTASATGRTLNVSARKDYGAETILATVSIANAGSINRDDVKIENLTVGDCKVIELIVDDVDQGSRPWLLDTIGLRVKEEGAR